MTDDMVVHREPVGAWVIRRDGTADSGVPGPEDFEIVAITTSGADETFSLTFGAVDFRPPRNVVDPDGGVHMTAEQAHMIARYVQIASQAASDAAGRG